MTQENNNPKISKEKILSTLQYAWQRQRVVDVSFSKKSTPQNIRGKIFQIDDDRFYIKTPKKVDRVDIDDVFDISAA